MRGLTIDEERSPERDVYRVCADCHRAKTIRGVWYLVPGRVADSPFVCEACFGSARVMRAVI